MHSTLGQMPPRRSFMAWAYLLSGNFNNASNGYSDVSFVSNLNQAIARPDPNDDAGASTSMKNDDRASNGYSDVSFVSNLNQAIARPDPNDDAGASTSMKNDDRVSVSRCYV
ncbi:unnamed protein product [Strongylus vulgaris]|uniref:Uncharacterized protein n=1 Tax=Strongylus vulgaris TaxID=40348 RepID=A0A3P7J2V7_STRVU|nr:unnamed protein product [Strongylus vulgaris]